MTFPPDKKYVYNKKDKMYTLQNDMNEVYTSMLKPLLIALEWFLIQMLDISHIFHEFGIFIMFYKKSKMYCSLPKQTKILCAWIWSNMTIPLNIILFQCLCVCVLFEFFFFLQGLEQNEV